MPNSQKGFVIPLVIAIVAILAIGGTVYLAENEKAEAPTVIESNVPVQATSTQANNSEIYITSISPSSGPAGTIVTLEGRGFNLGAQTFIGISGSGQKSWAPTFISSTTIKFVVPVDLEIGLHDISVFVSSKFTPTSNSVKFLVTALTVPENPVACNMDAFMCPDGTYVGRSGPKCEFVCPVSNEVSNWKAHTNNKYGFEFKYPANWEKVYDFTPSGSYYPIVSQTSIFITYPAQDVSGEVSVYDVNLEVALSGDLNLPDSTPTTTLVNGISWITISDSYGANYFTENHGRTYRISAAHDIVGKIVQSFRFIELGVEKPIVCTKDAFMCPDGTYVGRSGPKCEFICPK